MASFAVYFTCSIYILCLQYGSIESAKDKTLYCGACKAMFDEVEHSISKIDPKKKINVGSFRLDSKGKSKSVKVPLARSEGQITDLLENVCPELTKDYVIAKDKDTGVKRLKRMVTRDGKMSTDIDFTSLMSDAQNAGDKPPDTDSKKIRFACESIIEEHEDDIVELLGRADKNAAFKICAEVGEYCDEDEFEASNTKDEL